MISSFNLNNYKIQTSIGKGAFGEVFLVIEINTGKEYAAKITINQIKEDKKNSTESLTLFREIKLISSLDHPTILRFIGFSPTDFNGEPHPTIITGYAPNGSLRDIIYMESNGLSPDGWDNTRKLINIYGIACGMKYLHEHSIVHRDLKPENILLNEYLFPLIADFGLAKMTANTTQSLNMESIAGYKGTPIYMPPEYLSSQITSPLNDIYAFGIIVYEIMTNITPFADLNLVQLIRKICIDNYRPELTPDIPEAIQDLISRCWSKDPEERPSFEEIVKDFDENEDKYLNESINEGDFYDYKDFIKEYKSAFDLEHSIHFEDFIQKKYAKQRRKTTLRRTTVKRNPPQLDLPKKEEPNPMNENKDSSIKSENHPKTRKRSLIKVEDKRQKIVEEDEDIENIKIIEDQKEVPKREIEASPKQFNASIFVKIGMFGGGGCGKTMISCRYFQDYFDYGFIPSLNDDFSKTINIDGDNVTIRLIDTAGQDNFFEMRYSYMSYSDCFILTFGIDNESSIYDVYEIYHQIIDIKEGNAPLVVAASKADLRDEGYRDDLVPVEMYKKIEKDLNCPVIEVSAKTGKNINLLFETVLRRYFDMHNNIGVKKSSDPPSVF